MGERKGVNKYYPPDYDPSKGGLNKFQGTHALRERARKLHMGILIIRFEMPYNIWCEGCENHIGTGVRYNAEKKKVGMYYSTPIYQFRMKCHLCDNHFEIKTDPANLDYEIVSGARRQERRWDPTANEQIAPEAKEVTRKMASDAMFKLEHGVDDKKLSQEKKASLENLEEFQTRRWHDDYVANRKMRDTMRARRSVEQEQAVIDASYNLSVPLLPSNENDTKTAKLLQFTQTKTAEQLQKERRSSIDAHSVFAKLKPKSVSPMEKKAFARQSVKNIVNNSHSSFSKVRNTIRPQNLGIVVKKVDSRAVEESCESTIKTNEASQCKCKNSDVISQKLGESYVASYCNKCCHNSSGRNLSEAGTESSGSKSSVLPSSPIMNIDSNISDTPVITQASSTVDSSSPPKPDKVLSLVGYDYSGSESD